MFLLLLKFFIICSVFHGTFSQTCTGINERVGVCVNLIDCPELLKITQGSKAAQETISYLKRFQCGFEGTVAKVCCPTDGKGSNEAFISPTSPPDVTAHPNLRLLPETCGETTTSRFDGDREFFYEFPWMALLYYTHGAGDPPQNYTPGVDPTPWNYFDLIDECGLHAVEKPSPTITAGIGELPWIAKIVYLSQLSIAFDMKLVSICGGALISTTYVLTAKHCIVPGIMGVILGDYDSSPWIYCIGNLCADPPQTKLMLRYIKHPSFDIAIVVFNEPVKYTLYVRPICLPWNNSRIVSSSGVSLVAGWQSKNQSTGLKEFTPLHTHMMVQFQKDYCEKKLKMNFTEEKFCAGGHFDHDIYPCKGIDGGPLMKFTTTNGTRKYYVAGISSFGDGVCAVHNTIGFVNTSVILEWLFTVMEPVNEKPKTLFEHYFY